MLVLFIVVMGIAGIYGVCDYANESSHHENQH